MEERRAPLGGITRETFTNPDSPTHERQMLYDMMACIDSKVQLNARGIHDINANQPKKCIEAFDKRYLKRIYAVITGFLIMGVLIGYGVLTWKDVLKFIK